jgi:hypothetical protein
MEIHVRTTNLDRKDVNTVFIYISKRRRHLRGIDVFLTVSVSLLNVRGSYKGAASKLEGQAGVMRSHT